MQDILPSLGLSILMGVAVYVAGLLRFSDWQKLLIQVSIGGVIYVLFAKAFKMESYRYLVTSIKEVYISKSDHKELS